MIPLSPPQENPPAAEQVHGPHLGVQMLGEQGAESRKAFFIEVEPHPGQEEEQVVCRCCGTSGRASKPKLPRVRGSHSVFVIAWTC